MKKLLINLTRNFILGVLFSTIIFACSKTTKEDNSEEEERTKVEMVTTAGTIVLEFYNETPKHRDNFIKLVNEGQYDSLLFHRVINEFMIQGGDPESRNASPTDTLGNGDVGYTVDAEFHPDLFHKKGVLAAARDGNLARASSGIQFYIVQGRVFNDSTLDVAEGRINGWLAEHYFKNDPANKPLVDSLQMAIDKKDFMAYRKYDDSIRNMAKVFTGFEKHVIPEDQREVYKTIGGTPHLDQNYTVYGEVVSGLEVVDKIAGVQTNPMSRPIEDVRILSAKIVE